MSEYSVGDSAYFAHSMFLMSPDQLISGNRLPSFRKGDIVKTKYGPQLTCRVTEIRLHGYSVVILDIDSSKQGHYSSWPEYKRIVENPYLTDGEKTDRIIEEIL